MNTQSLLVNEDECLPLLAKLGNLTRVLSENNSSTLPEYSEVNQATVDQRMAIDAALRLKSWSHPDVLESVENLYAAALGNPDPDIALGIITYLDHLFGVQVPLANSGGQNVTFGVVCAADMTGFDAIGAFRDVSPLKAWIAAHLSVPESSLYVHPMAGLPDTIFEGLFDFAKEMGGMTSSPSPEDYKWSTALVRCEGNATDIVFWVRYASTDVAELQRVADMMGAVGSNENEQPLSLLIDNDNAAGELEVVPCVAMWPFSACVESVFNPVLDALVEAVDRLETRGIVPESISAELTISMEDNNLYGYDDSFVIELRDLATGFILARVPGFDGVLLDMFKPYFVDIASHFEFAEIVVRKEKDAPAERYIREED